MPAPHLRLYLLGAPKIESQNMLIHLQRQKALALLAYLALADEPRSREELATLLWPESPPSKALASLRRTLACLRQAFGNEIFCTTQFTLGLVKTHIWVDLAQFRTRLALCETHKHSPSTTCPDCLSLLGEAVELVRGPFMAGFSLRDSEPFEHWQADKSTQVRQEVYRAKGNLIIELARAQNVSKAIEYAIRWLGMDALQEKNHRILMQLYAANGQRELALQQYHICKTLLVRELDMLPQAETTALYHAIFAGNHPSYPEMAHPFPDQKPSL